MSPIFRRAAWLAYPALVVLCPSAARADDLAAPYRAAAARIIAEARCSDGAYRKLEELCDDIGHRLSGSASLERAVIWAQLRMLEDGHENVRAEPVMVPRWVRGDESLVMHEPLALRLPVLGLGGSVGTPPEGITAEVVAVRDETELQRLGEAVRDKIVLFNWPMKQWDPIGGTGYGEAVRFRTVGARWAAGYGARATLVRSVTARSLRSPHTGAMSYEGSPKRIPAAAVSTEDAERMARLHARGIPVIVTLRMAARSEGEAESANVLGELRGRERPEEVVVIGGHIDSWDVGQGAHDDGCGVVTCMEALSVLRRLGLIPRRTIRAVLFTNEENGLAGGRAYARDHEAELPQHVAAIEMDSGGFAPEAIGIEMQDRARQVRAAAQLCELVDLLDELDAARVRPGFSGADVSQMRSGGVALLGLDVENSTYFDYHHTEADTLDKVNPSHLASDVAAMAVMAYVLADMPGRLGD